MTNGGGAIVLVLFQVTVIKVCATPSHSISTPVLGRGHKKMTDQVLWLFGEDKWMTEGVSNGRTRPARVRIVVPECELNRA